MGDVTQPAPAETFEGLVAQTDGPRRTIVAGLRFYGGQASTQQLRRYGKIPSRNYHFNVLEEQEVIVQAGDDASGGGDAAKVYRLTDLGREVAEAVESSEGTSTVTEIEDRITHLEEKVEKLDGLLQRIANRIEDDEKDKNTD